VGGFYGVPLLFIMALTGWHISNHGSKNTPRSQVQMALPETKLIDHLWQQVVPAGMYGVVRVNFPADSTDTWRIMGMRPGPGFRRADTYWFDQYSGRLLQEDSYRNWSWRETFWQSAFEIHTGRVAGLPGKILAFLTGLLALSLPVTGLVIWLGRREKRSTPKRYQAVPVA